MLKKLGIIAFVYVGALVCAFLVASTAKADDLKFDDGPGIATFSRFKTFGDFGKWLRAYDLATSNDLRAIDAILKKNGLTFKSELAPGKFTAGRLSWGDLFITKLSIGDWKTIGGKILIAHKETPIDGLFDQAMKTFDPRSARFSPADLFISRANALATANTRATGAAAWTWLTALHRTTTAIWKEITRLPIKIKCTADRTGYIVEAHDGIPERPVDPEVIKVINAKSPGILSKCVNGTNTEIVAAVYNSPGKTPAERLKYTGEFSPSLADAWDAKPANAAHAAR